MTPTKKYSYAVVPLHLMLSATVAWKKGAYVSKEQDTENIQKLLENGFRWIRTEDGQAILEKEETRG